MTNETLALFGRLLYGDHWAAQLARAVGVTPAHMRRIANGERGVPDNMAATVRTLALERVSAIYAALDVT